MKRPVDTINKAIVRSGRSLTGQKWYRVLLALLLLTAGAALLYQGIQDDNPALYSIGGIFVIYSFLVCFYVRKAESTIAEAHRDLEILVKKLEKKGKKDEEKDHDESDS